MVNIYILLTKGEGRSGKISARGLDSTDRAQRGLYKKDRGPIFSQYGPEQAWLIRDLLHDWRKQRLKDTSAGSFGTMPGPRLKEYWTGNRAFWLVDFSYWPSDCLSRVIMFIYDNTFPVSQFSWSECYLCIRHSPLWSLLGLLMKYISRTSFTAHQLYCISLISHILLKTYSCCLFVRLARIWSTKILRHVGMRRWSFFSNLICKRFRKVNLFFRPVFLYTVLYLCEAETCLLCGLIELSWSFPTIPCLYLR